MSVTTTEPMPLILTDASIKIGGTELACVANHIELSPDTAVTTLDTMCGSRDYPGTVKWSLVATLYQSFDTGATEDTLSAAVAAYRVDGTPVDYVVAGYKDRPIGPDNPSWSGQAIPKDYSPINGDAGDASTIDLEWSCTAPPTKSVTPENGGVTFSTPAAGGDETGDA
jgi:hypothetical protein